MLSISNVDGLTATRNEALRGIRRSRFSLHLNTARRRRWLLVQLVTAPALDIEEGEFVSLMGASGTGKSTLLNLIASIDRPDSGSITIDGTKLTAANFEVDVSTISTNDRRRDDNVASALSVSQFPKATFALTSPVELGADAASGKPIKVDASGTLTIKGVSKPVTIPIEAQLVNGTVVVVGSTDIVFADYGVSVPRSAVVLSVDNHGVIEFQLLLTPA